MPALSADRNHMIDVCRSYAAKHLRVDRDGLAWTGGFRAVSRYS